MIAPVAVEDRDAVRDRAEHQVQLVARPRDRLERGRLRLLAPEHLADLVADLRHQRQHRVVGRAGSQRVELDRADRAGWSAIGKRRRGLQPARDRQASRVPGAAHGRRAGPRSTPARAARRRGRPDRRSPPCRRPPSRDASTMSARFSASDDPDRPAAGARRVGAAQSSRSRAASRDRRDRAQDLGDGAVERRALEQRAGAVCRVDAYASTRRRRHRAHASRARRMPLNCQRAAGGKKLR